MLLSQHDGLTLPVVSLHVAGDGGLLRVDLAVAEDPSVALAPLQHTGQGTVMLGNAVCSTVMSVKNVCTGHCVE